MSEEGATGYLDLLSPEELQSTRSLQTVTMVYPVSSTITASTRHQNHDVCLPPRLSPPPILGEAKSLRDRQDASTGGEEVLRHEVLLIEQSLLNPDECRIWV